MRALTAAISSSSSIVGARDEIFKLFELIFLFSRFLIVGREKLSKALRLLENLSDLASDITEAASSSAIGISVISDRNEMFFDGVLVTLGRIDEYRLLEGAER